MPRTYRIFCHPGWEMVPPVHAKVDACGGGCPIWSYLILNAYCYVCCSPLVNKSTSTPTGRIFMPKMVRTDFLPFFLRPKSLWESLSQRLKITWKRFPVLQQQKFRRSVPFMICHHRRKNWKRLFSRPPMNEGKSITNNEIKSVKKISIKL